MSKHKTIWLINNELSKLNHEIDLKIIKGISYHHEARRHRSLTSQLKRLSGSGWLNRSLSSLLLF